MAMSGSNTQAGAKREYGGIGAKTFNFGSGKAGAMGSVGTNPWLIGGVAVVALAGIWLVMRKK